MVYIRDGWKCVYCDQNLEFADPCDRTLDHVIPRVKNGSHEGDNLVTSCRSCNSRRQDTEISIFTTPDRLVKILYLVGTPLSDKIKIAARQRLRRGKAL